MASSIRGSVSASVIILLLLAGIVVAAVAETISMPGPFPSGGCEYVNAKGGDEYCEVFTPFSWVTGTYYLLTASISGGSMQGAVNYIASSTQTLASASDLYPGLGVDSATKGMMTAAWFRIRDTPPGFLMPSASWGALSQPTTGTPPEVQGYVKVTVTNTQEAGTGAGFDQRLAVNFSQYSSYLSPYAGNVAFYSSNWTQPYAWLENAGPTPSHDTGDSVWVRLADPIPGRGSITLYMAFLGTNESRFSSGGYWGEAPQLSASYGTYDNGASVFVAYDNFKGTSLSAMWVNDGAYVNVDDGVTIAGSSPVLDWSRDMIKLKQDFGGKDFTADSLINTLATGRTGVYIVDSASEAAHLRYDTGAADTVLVDGSPSYFWIDVKVALAGQTATITQTTIVTQTTTVTQQPTGQGTHVPSLILVALGVLLTAVILMAGALAGISIYLARRRRWAGGPDQGG